MIKFFIFLLLFSSLALAESLESQFLDYEGRSVERESVDEVLELALKVAKKNKIKVEILKLKDRDNRSYKALLISTEGASQQNIEARRVATHMYGLPMIFSPWDLGRLSSLAFFHSKGEHLGVSYRFLSHGINDSSYQHELLHAYTYSQLLKGVEMDWAGEVKLLKGERLHVNGEEGYIRYASIDELMTTALSAKLESEELARLRKKLKGEKFVASEEAEELLGNIYYTLRTGKYLALQTAGLVKEALGSEFKINEFELSLGKTKKTLFSVVFLLHSSSREIINSRGVDVLIPKGSQMTMLWVKRPSEFEVRSRLKTILNVANKVSKSFLAAEKTIDVLIEYPQMEKTNFKELERLSPLPLSHF